jgi:hypothetical protein
VHPKLSLAGVTTSQGKKPWSASPPAIASKQKQQFRMHPLELRLNFIGFAHFFFIYLLGLTRFMIALLNHLSPAG